LIKNIDKKDIIMKKITKLSPYIIRLHVNQQNLGLYRVSEELFLKIKKEIEPYRSLPPAPKKVRCIETGKIFAHAKEAYDWLAEQGKTSSYHGVLSIKNVCNGKHEKMYGYHWEFVD